MPFIDTRLSIEDLTYLLSSPIQLSDTAAQRLLRNRSFLEQELEKNTKIYGITTGFGPLVSEEVTREDQIRHQYNLLQQLSGSAGEELDYETSRLIFLIRIHTLSQGVSGVSLELIEHMISLYNLGLAPVFRHFGSVGASGDLVPLSSLARMLVGSDPFWDKDGVKHPGNELEKFTKCPIYSLKEKEGLALVNGTSYSLGITLQTFRRVNQLLVEQLYPLISLHWFLFEDSLQHLSEIIYHVKAHESAQKTAQHFRDWIHPLKPELSKGTPQPPYSSRSVVLWLGAANQRLNEAKQILETELNAVDDNPLIFDEEGLILHAANFQGTYVSYAADLLSQAQVQIMLLLERIVNRITHPKLNDGLPAFLADEPVGLNSGLQGLQLLLTSLTADMRTRAVNHSLSSISTNADNQDIVSMSANAAHNSRELAERFEIGVRVFKIMILRALQFKGDLSKAPKLQAWYQNEKERLKGISFSDVNLDYKLILNTIL